MGNKQGEGKGVMEMRETERRGGKIQEEGETQGEGKGVKEMGEVDKEGGRRQGDGGEGDKEKRKGTRKWERGHREVGNR